MSEEMPAKCLRQVEHIHRYLLHRYFATVNQVMMAAKWSELNQHEPLLAATIYQRNHDRNRKLWNIGSTERHILYIHTYIYCWNFKWENWNHLFCFVLNRPSLAQVVKVWSRSSCICGILYLKLNGVDAINKSPNLELLSERTSSI
jgi:hypothetical protein